MHELRDQEVHLRLKGITYLTRHVKYGVNTRWDIYEAAIVNLAKQRVGVNAHLVNALTSSAEGSRGDGRDVGGDHSRSVP